MEVIFAAGRAHPVCVGGTFLCSAERGSLRTLFDAIMRGSAGPQYAYPYDRLIPIKSFVDEAAKDAANEVFGVRQSVKDVLNTRVRLH